VVQSERMKDVRVQWELFFFHTNQLQQSITTPSSIVWWLQLRNQKSRHRSAGNWAGRSLAKQALWQRL
jgi:hypothetical protein